MWKYKVKLSKEERERLVGLTRTGKSDARTITHAHILLAADEGSEHGKGMRDQEIAEGLKIGEKTVQRIRQRYAEESLEAALSRRAHRRTRPRKLSGEQEAHLVALSCSNPPEGRSRWTLKLLSNRLVALDGIENVSATTVGRTLKKMK